MKVLSTVVMAGIFCAGVAQVAVAGDPAELAKASGCLVCHQIDKKVVGPAYKDVAAKYKGNKEAVGMLIERLKKGGSGTWGPIPMPSALAPNPMVPNAPKLTDADLKSLVDWVLSQ